MNREEFNARIEMNRPKLMKIARGMVRSSDCEDAVQSALLSAWEHLPQLRNEAVFDAWLMQIMINRCRQIQRGYQRDKEKNAALLAAAGKPYAQEEALDEALELLSEEERRLIHQHYQQGRSIKELSAAAGKTENAIKMRLYRARNHLRMILISLLLLILLAATAIGTGMIDVNWFLQNRRVEPAAMDHAMMPECVDVAYDGNMLDIAVSDAVWDEERLVLSFVFSIAGRERDVLTVHSGNLGVDGVRRDYIWTDEGIILVEQWADGKPVRVFSVDGWYLGGMDLLSREDYLSDGRGDTFMAELYLDWIRPEQYETLLDEYNKLSFEAEVTLREYASGAVLEEETIVLRVDAPTAEAWREMYEAFYR